jgi:hypothetical protein
MASHLAVLVENFSRGHDWSPYHGRQITFYTAEDGAVPAQDVAELVDIFAVETSGEFLM